MRNPMPRRRTALLLALTLASGLMAFAPAQSAEEPFCDISLTTSPNCYVAVDDDTVIAMSVKVPSQCTDESPCPAIFEMAGYENGSAEGQTTTGEFVGPSAPLADDSRQLTRMFDGNYATVHASVRGSGCSAGEFDLFSLRSARDGAWLIDNWVAKQNWSNGRVGIMGHSYSGITGFMIASQRPEALRAVTVSGLIDDLYRGITYPGGVSNLGFPPLWTLGVRVAYDVVGGLAQGLGRPIWRNVEPLNPDGQTFQTEAQSGQCAKNVATHNRTVINDPVVQGTIADTDGTWWQVRALSTFADRISVPTHIAGAYQDEQTGPRGTTRLWEQLGTTFKRLMITNGDHGTNQSGYVMADRKAWMDFFMRGVHNTDINPFTNGFQIRQVRVLQEFDSNAPNSVISDTRFPLTNTRWTPYYFQAGGALGGSPGTSASTPDTYLSGSGRQSWSYQAGPSAGPPFTTADGPDELTYTSAPVTGNLSIAGPITANLWISSSAPDTEMFVQLIDVAPNGERTYLQRGILKASHRAIDTQRSDCVNASNGKVSCLSSSSTFMYRPHRPHTNPTNVTPGTPVEYLVEVWPVGHVFREGHRIMVKVMAPPRVDSFYAYVQRTAPARNELYRDDTHQSRITLPVIPFAPVGPKVPSCGALDAVRCVAKPNG